MLLIVVNGMMVATRGEKEGEDKVGVGRLAKSRCGHMLLKPPDHCDDENDDDDDYDGDYDDRDGHDKNDYLKGPLSQSKMLF